MMSALADLLVSPILVLSDNATEAVFSVDDSGREKDSVAQREEAFGNGLQIRLLPEISLQCETYMGGHKNKKKIKHADLPTESQESSSDKCETGNAEHSMRDLSSESPKASSLTEISESRDRGKNDGDANQAEEHSAR
jgi:hypothetical protein